MNRKLVNAGLISFASVAIAVGSSMCVSEIKSGKELGSAHVKAKVVKNLSYEKIGGFYDENRNLSRIMVNSVCFPLEIGFCVSTYDTYTPKDEEFERYANILKQRGKQTL